MTANTSATRKAKGNRLEKLIAKRMDEVLGEYGITAKKMPMSGAIEGFKSDQAFNGALQLYRRIQQLKDVDKEDRE